MWMLTVTVGARYLEFESPRFVDRREADAIDLERALRRGTGATSIVFDDRALLPPRR